jgi:UDP-N-acetylglucosamine:LPS N-acetylglucosamine transferase
MKKHLVVDISAHGFGHIAQTSAVLNALNPDQYVITIRSVASVDLLKQRIKLDFQHIQHQQDSGMVMHDALRTDAEKSFQWYQQFHANYAERIAEASQQLGSLKPDVLFCNIPYLSLEAAHSLNIPSIALCSLNWADIFYPYCQHIEGAEKIYHQILTAYQKADVFLQPTPTMPMDGLSNTKTISPIIPKGNKHDLQTLTGKTNTQFVLIALGGIGIDYPLASWPRIDDVVWVFPDQALYQDRIDFLPQSNFDMPYVDLLSSCDLILTKTGYGTQTEAVMNQVPTLCLMRGDWPEEPHLFAWHQKHGEIDFLEWKQIEQGLFSEQVVTLLGKKWDKDQIIASGAIEAANEIDPICE